MHLVSASHHLSYIVLFVHINITFNVAVVFLPFRSYPPLDSSLIDESESYHMHLTLFLLLPLLPSNCIFPVASWCVASIIHSIRLLHTSPTGSFTSFIIQHPQSWWRLQWHSVCMFSFLSIFSLIIAPIFNLSTALIQIKI